MFDAIEDSQYPPAGPGVCFAGYVDGSLGDQPDYHWLTVNRPGSRLLSIALDPAHDADCLDIEDGAATPSSAAAWYERQKARGVARPCFYASASVMQANMVPVIEAAGIARASVRLWTAHYQSPLGAHICGPSTCGELSIDADGTQWTENAAGRDLDQSLLLPNFFSTPPAPGPVPAWQEAAMKALPLVTEGDTDVQAVRTVQGLLCARGHAVTVDGSFGPATLTALEAFQRTHGLTIDGKAGPSTWQALMGVA